MNRFTKFLTQLFIGCFLVCQSATVYAECLVFPPVCPIEACGYQTQESPSQQMVQKATSAYKTGKKIYKAARRISNKVMTLTTSVVSKVTRLAAAVTTWPFKMIGRMLGLTESAQDNDDVNSITQDHRHGNIEVPDRMNHDLETFKTEANSDYESQKFNKERRQYIRQQATISLMAYALVLKATIADVKDVMDDIESSMKKLETQSSGDPSNSYNESSLIASNNDLRETWFKLLSIQKQVEAVKLEFAANQAIAGIQNVQKVPTITSANK